MCKWTHVVQTCVVQGSAVSLQMENSEAMEVSLPHPSPLAT